MQSGRERVEERNIFEEVNNLSRELMAWIGSCISVEGRREEEKRADGRG